ncbi:MAG: hypothetical protein ACLPVY_11970 [Acidimicrobiia bacterium]
MLVAVGLVAGGVVTSAALSGAAPTPTWSLSPSPSPFRPLDLPMASVSCSSATSCFAVGTRSDVAGYPGVPYVAGESLAIEQWDGTRWSTDTSPDTGLGPGGAKLHAVSCVSATSCVAVGAQGSTDNTATLSESWDGTSWSLDAIPNPIDAISSTLEGIACSSASSCFAVGHYSPTDNNTLVETLIEQWDGASWTVAASPNPTKAVGSTLNGVACATATNCFAVGSHVEAANKGGTLVEHWDGTSWTIVPTPTPTVRPVAAPVVTPTLNAVSCTGPTSCFAVGYTASDALIEQWDGTTWSLLSSPVPHIHLGIAVLQGVSCTSATDCFAVGVAFDTSLAKANSAVPNSITEHWNGTAWTILARPSAVPTNKAYFGELDNLYSVSCTTTSCFAVGDSALPERWDGSRWSLSPLAATTSNSSLDAVTCPSPTSCYAVGTAAPLLDESDNPLVEHWDGTHWSILPAPTPVGINVHAAFTSISCPSPADCRAVGSYDFISLFGPNPGTVKALMEHWNGKSWSLTANPTPPGAVLWYLSAVSCVGATDCNAVGIYQTIIGQGDSRHLLAEHWNGTRWSVVAIPSLSRAVLSAVSCSSASNCFAVGGQNGAYGTQQPLVEHWNGKSWSIIATPEPPTGTFFQMNAVSCRTDSDCTAVGYSEANTLTYGTQQPLVEHWNGKDWSVVASPTPTNPNPVPGTALNGVTCPNATSCTAVGTAYTSASLPPSGQPLFEQWNGTKWSIVPSPIATSTTTTFADSVACPTTTSCIAVGGSFSPNGLTTLIEQST